MTTKSITTLYGEQKKLCKLISEIETQKQLLLYQDCEIEKQITEEALKNETARKARRVELKQEQDYLDVLTNLREAEHERRLIDCKVEYLRNCISFEKLELRLQANQAQLIA